MTERSLDELIHYMRPIALRSEGWACGFCWWIVKQSRRPDWRPTPKQLAMMRRLVTELFAAQNHDGDDELLEDVA